MGITMREQTYKELDQTSGLGSFANAVVGSVMTRTEKITGIRKERDLEIDAYPSLAGPIRLGFAMQEVVDSNAYEYLIFFLVLFSGLCVGAEIGYEIENEFFRTLETLFFVVFLLEAVTKILCRPHKPWLYFVGKFRWQNNFDFVLVVLSCPGLVAQGASASMLRLIRLARVIRIVESSPRMKVVIFGLIKGLEAVVYVLILMFIVFYIYSVVGVTLFKENDPWHFRNIPLAFETLLRCASMEDWSDVWYTNYYGCDIYGSIGGIYGLYTTNATLAANHAAFPKMHTCNPQAQPVLATLYFISFIVVASFVLLSLFIGSVLVSTMTAIVEIAQEHKDSVRSMRSTVKALFLKAYLSAMDGSSSSHSDVQLRSRKRRQKVMRSLLKAWQLSKNQKLSDFAYYHKFLIEQLASQIPATYISCSMDLDWVFAQQLPNPMQKAYFMLSSFSKMIRDNTIFIGLINTSIVFASVMLAFQVVCEEPNCKEFYNAPDQVLGIIFTAEVLVKFFACGFAPRDYFKDPWNILDLLVVIMHYMPSVGPVALIVRMIRLLRILKVLRVIPKLRMLVLALVDSGESIVMVSVLQVLFFYIFSLVACNIFRSNDRFHFRDMHTSLMSLFRVATAEDWTDIMYTAQYGCREMPVPGTFQCVNQFNHSDAVAAANSLYTSDEVQCIGTGFHECNHNVAHGTSAVLFFVMFYIVGGLVFLNLFTGVVTVGMADAMAKIEEELGVDHALREYAEKHDLPPRQMKYYKQAFDAVDLTDGNILDQDDFAWTLGCIYISGSPEEIAKLVAVVRNGRVSA
jgi:voltage-gated sodium channel